jgi:hypothetical protein
MPFIKTASRITFPSVLLAEIMIGTRKRMVAMLDVHAVVGVSHGDDVSTRRNTPHADTDNKTLELIKKKTAASPFCIMNNRSCKLALKALSPLVVGIKYIEMASDELAHQT